MHYVTCANCGHPGSHAEVAGPEGMLVRVSQCPQCPQCQTESSREG